MGCLCSKSSKPAMNSVDQVGVVSSMRSFAQNPLISEEFFQETGKSSVISLKPLSQAGQYTELISLHQMMFADHPKELSESLIHYPSADALLARGWICKRGHVVRTWKKRYCVLDKSEIKYYSDAQDQPPFGKGHKGGIAMLGAICTIKLSDDQKIINVEIFGNYGEKDLFFYVENDVPGQRFVRMLEWAIRKVTFSILLRNLKASLTSTKVMKKTKSEKYDCSDFLQQQSSFYTAAIERLSDVKLVQFISVRSNGQLFVQPGLVQLWSAIGEKSPAPTTDSQNFGFAYQYIDDKCADRKLEGESRRIIPFKDVADYRFEYLDNISTSWLRERTNDFHHATCTHSPYLLATIHTMHGHTLHILACCLYDYGGWLVALQHALLHVNSEEKSKAIVTSVRSEKHYQHKAAVVKAVKAFAS